jgi:hypothetical protein
MTDLREADRRVFGTLTRAIARWNIDADAKALEQWFERELDRHGIPASLELSSWPECVAALLEARAGSKGWTKGLDSRILELVRSLLRFSRPDGSLAIASGGPDLLNRRRSILSTCASAFPGSSEARVIGWWLRRPDSAPVPPPLPACSSDRGPLAMLRASWQKGGDMLAVDHRRPGFATRFELVGRGSHWLGPDWTLAGRSGAASKPRTVAWLTSSVVDLVEWGFRSEGVRFTRTALLFRGRRLALLAEQVDGRSAMSEPMVSTYSLPPGISAEPIADSRGLRLRGSAKGRNAHVMPLGLPSLPYETDRGQFLATAGGGSLSLKQLPRGRRWWMPLLVSWDGLRNRKRLTWRSLTVSEDAKICPPDLAFAVRVSWGRDETYVIYRSLGPPALRAFLGHQTRARFLIGQFTEEGTVEPLVSVD